MSPLPSPNFVGTDSGLGICGTCRISLSANDTNPQLLPCLHSVCTNCIPPPNQEVAVCPVCGMLFSLQSVTPHPLFCNVTSMSSSQKCGGCECAAVEGWCVECGEALCVDCVSAHRRVRMTRDHTIKTQVTSSGFARKTYCPIHKDEPYKLYCITCSQLTCRDCQLTLHRSHSFQFVGEVVSERRQKLEALVHRVKEQRAYTQRCIQDLEGRLLDLEDEMDGFKQNVKEALKEIRDILVQTAMKLMSDTKVMYTSELDRLRGQQSVLQKLLERQAYLLAFSEKTLGSMDQLVLLSCANQVQQELQTVLTQIPPPFAHMLQVSLHLNKQEVETALSHFGKVSWRLIPFSCSKKNRPPKKPKETPLIPGQLTSLEPLCTLRPAGGAPAVPPTATRGSSVPSTPTKVMAESTTSSPGCSEGRAGLDSVTSMECEPSSTMPDSVGKPSSPPESPPLVDMAGVTATASMERLAPSDERSGVTALSGSSPTPPIISSSGGGSASEETPVVVVQDRPIKGCAEALPQEVAASSTASEMCRFRRTDSEAVESCERVQRDSEAVESCERVQRDSEAVESCERVRRDSEAVESCERVQRDSEAVESCEHVERDSEAVESCEHVQRDSEAAESCEHVERQETRSPDVLVVQLCSSHTETDTKHLEEEEEEEVSKCPIIITNVQAVGAVVSEEKLECTEGVVSDEVTPGVGSCLQEEESKVIESECPVMGSCEQGEESEHVREVESFGATTERVQECESLGVTTERVQDLESVSVTTEHVQESFHVSTEHVRERESLGVTTEHSWEFECVGVTTERVRESASHSVTAEHVQGVVSDCVNTEHVQAAPPDVSETDQSSMAPSDPSPLPPSPKTLCQERPTPSFLKALNLTRSPGLVRNPAFSASQGTVAAGHETDTINSYCCPLEDEDFDEEDDCIDVEMQDEEIYHLLPKKHWLPQVSVYHMPLPSISTGQPLPQFRFLQVEGSMEFLIQEIPEDNESAERKTHTVQQRHCVVCHVEGMLYRCATCNRGYHKGCHIPPLITKLSEGWVCGLCLDVSAEVRRQDCFEGGSCMSVQDQKICEYLLLSLWCSKYRPVLFMQNQESAVSIMLIRGRLLQKLAPPYRTPSEFVSDIWLLLDFLLKRAKWKAECEKQVKSLQMIFSRRLQRVFGLSLHPSLLRNPHRQRPRGRPRKQPERAPERGKERKAQRDGERERKAPPDEGRERRAERGGAKAGRPGNAGKRKAGRKEKGRPPTQKQSERLSQMRTQLQTQAPMRSQPQVQTESRTQMQIRTQPQSQMTQMTQSAAPRTSEWPSSGVQRFILLEKTNGRTHTRAEVMRLQPHT